MNEPYELAQPEPEPTPDVSQPVIFPDRHRFCRGCGYDLHRSATARCAECGRPFKPDDLTTFDLDPPQPRWRHLPQGPWQRVALLVGLFAVYALPVWFPEWVAGGWVTIWGCCTYALGWPIWIAALCYVGLSLFPAGWIDSTMGHVYGGAAIGAVAQGLLTIRWVPHVNEMIWGIMAIAAIIGALAGLMRRRATI